MASTRMPCLVAVMHTLVPESTRRWPIMLPLSSADRDVTRLYTPDSPHTGPEIHGSPPILALSLHLVTVLRE